MKRFAVKVCTQDGSCHCFTAIGSSSADVAMGMYETFGVCSVRVTTL